MNLLDNALHDGALILDAYARFATTLIGTLIFPYAAIVPASSAQSQSEAQHSRSRHTGIVSVVVALLIGAVLGRRLFARR